MEIKRVIPSADTGYYECRARNALVKDPAIGRVRVIVTRPKVVTTTPLPSSSFDTFGTLPSDSFGTSSSSGLSNLGGQSPPVVSTNWPIRGKDKPFIGLSDWAIRSCPIPDFCLNGGSCSFYESVGEYVCQ